MILVKWWMHFRLLILVFYLQHTISF